jgi:L-ascorbate metabolism protein UlaG (beta-lactamase superfamily)
MIKYFGHSMVQINDVLTIDPHDGGSIGLKRYYVRSKLLLLTHLHYDHDAVEVVKAEEVKVKFYGEMSSDGHRIRGFKTFHDMNSGRRRGENTVYEITAGGFKYVHLGDLGHPLSDEIVDELRGATVLFVPAGGVTTLNPRQAAELVRLLSPRVVVPIHYWVKGLLMPLNTEEEFVTQLGWNVVRMKGEMDEGNIANHIIALLSPP